MESGWTAFISGWKIDSSFLLVWHLPGFQASALSNKSSEVGLKSALSRGIPFVLISENRRMDEVLRGLSNLREVSLSIYHSYSSQTDRAGLGSKQSESLHTS